MKRAICEGRRVVGFLLVLGAVASAQGEELPAEVRAALEQAAPQQQIYNVTGEVHFVGNVLRADQLVFSKGGRLVFDSCEQPWLVIAAPMLKFADPSAQSSIQVKKCPSPAAAAGGSQGSAGADGAGDGANGQPGAPGTDGESGAAPALAPHLYIVVDKVLGPSVDGEVELSKLELKVLLPGVDGALGGPGGQGGSGGGGRKGRNASDGAFDCKHGGGNGGSGGHGGRGGKGGKGGNGGKGGDLTVFASEFAAKTLSYASVEAKGGSAGLGGAGGKSGVGGSGGSSGNGSHHCSGGHGGGTGGLGGEGAKGEDGLPGSAGNFTTTFAKTNPFKAAAGR